MKKEVHKTKQNLEILSENLHQEKGKDLLFSVRQETVTAPYPPPNVLKEYKSVDKTFPDRMLHMAEKEQHFRHLSTIIGQISSILISAIGFGAALYSGVHNAQWTGAVIAGATSYIIYVFKSKNPDHPTNNKDSSKE